MNDVATVVAAALAGVPAGVQSLGPWAGRRQLFVRFAGEAETATMYVAPALARELERQQSRSAFHSIVIGGRDALGNVPFLLAAFALAKPALPVMLDTDGQRPEAIGALLPHLALVPPLYLHRRRHLPLDAGVLPHQVHPVLPAGRDGAQGADPLGHAGHRRRPGPGCRT